MDIGGSVREGEGGEVELDPEWRTGVEGRDVEKVRGEVGACERREGL